MKLSELFSHWETIRREMIDGVANLTQEQLDWLPPGGLNSIGDLLRHISETELWWIGNVVFGKNNYRDLTKKMAPDLNSITKELDISFRDVRELLNSKTSDNLDETYSNPEIDEKYGLKWIIFHTFEHETRHRGQIFMMMRLQGIAPPHV